MDWLVWDHHPAGGHCVCHGHKGTSGAPQLPQDRGLFLGIVKPRGGDWGVLLRVFGQGMAGEREGRPWGGRVLLGGESVGLGWHYPQLGHIDKLNKAFQAPTPQEHQNPKSIATNTATAPRYPHPTKSTAVGKTT